jgi:hypothetical protein
MELVKMNHNCIAHIVLAIMAIAVAVHSDIVFCAAPPPYSTIRSKFPSEFLIGEPHFIEWGSNQVQTGDQVQEMECNKASSLDCDQQRLNNTGTPLHSWAITPESITTCEECFTKDKSGNYTFPPIFDRLTTLYYNYLREDGTRMSYSDLFKIVDPTVLTVLNSDDVRRNQPPFNIQWNTSTFHEHNDIIVMYATDQLQCTAVSCYEEGWSYNPPPGGSGIIHFDGINAQPGKSYKIMWIYWLDGTFELTRTQDIYSDGNANGNTNSFTGVGNNNGNNGRSTGASDINGGNPIFNSSATLFPPSLLLLISILSFVILTTIITNC